MHKIGVITIGESPRTDLIPEIKRFFSSNITFVERGVLDNLSNIELAEISPKNGQTTLISRKNNGTPVEMAKEKIIPMIQSIIDDLHHKVDLIILACTGVFPTFSSNIPIIYPDHLLNYVSQGIFKVKENIGVIVPLPEQINSIKAKWATAGFQAITATCSPYHFQEQAMIKAIVAFENANVNTVVLDCIGYTQPMKELIQKQSDKFIILSRNIIFKTVSELF
ncbi:AroM family protein [Oceanobacillus jeddahense]|uniref:AroM family protein n=1 Tax=Oceanobacillus jeddahense TaxID=1462527 RepID=UPI000595DA1B|nr:AroM family protein [Oceanobacillus jeddahense]